MLHFPPTKAAFRKTSQILSHLAQNPLWFPLPSPHNGPEPPLPWSCCWPFLWHPILWPHHPPTTHSLSAISASWSPEGTEQAPRPESFSQCPLVILTCLSPCSRWPLLKGPLSVRPLWSSYMWHTHTLPTLHSALYLFIALSTTQHHDGSLFIDLAVVSLPKVFQLQDCLHWPVLLNDVFPSPWRVGRMAPNTHSIHTCWINK